MARLLSVSHTTAQVEARTKTQTRRLGWWTDSRGRRLVVPGDLLWLCRKVMGRAPGEPLDRLALVQVTAVRREPLWLITADDVAAEGFPEWEPADFVEFFCITFRTVPATEVTVIDWRYLDLELPQMWLWCPVCGAHDTHDPGCPIPAHEALLAAPAGVAR